MTSLEMYQEAERRIEEAWQIGAVGLTLIFGDKSSHRVRTSDQTTEFGLNTLPESLRKLTQLEQLSLANNNLTVLPDWLCELSHLQVLILDNNRLLSIPKSLGELTKLRILSIDNNKLDKLPDSIGQLFHLQFLSLNNNQLNNLPEEIGFLNELQVLSAGGNKLDFLPNTFSQLNSLQELRLGGNKLIYLPTWLGQLTHLKKLRLSGNGLTSLPETLCNIKLLQEFDISNNYIHILPNWLSEFYFLQKLWIGNNNLAQLPDIFDKLTNLKEIHLSHNRLSNLPSSLNKLINLEWLSLRHNQLVDIPDTIIGLNKLKFLWLDNNPLQPELAAAYQDGMQTVLSYLRAPRISLYEAKLIIVGEGDVGKSSLLGALRGDPWQPNRPTTHGIEIKSVSVIDPMTGTVITLNGWDFGGQQVYRPTHQLFFSAPAVYLVVWKPREGPQQGAVQEWIRLVKYREPTAKILIVATHSGQRQPDIDRQGLWELFGRETVLDFQSVDSEQGIGLEALRTQIGAMAAALPEMGRWVPKNWLAAREALREQTQPYLPWVEILSLCQAAGMDERGTELFVRVSHELGHLIHYHNDDILRNIVILKPDWLTKALSFVLDDAITRQRKGLVSFEHLRSLWQNPARPATEQYPSSLHPIFLRLMERFELSYRIADDLGGAIETSTSLIAQLVPNIKPLSIPIWEEYEAPQQMQLCRIVEAGSDQSATAEGIFYRLIVRMHRFSLGRRHYQDSVHWQRGLVVDDGFNGLALLEHVGNDIRITVKAVYPNNLLSRLTGDVKWLVETSWQGLQCPIMVPCIAPCGLKMPGTGLFDVETLLGYRARGRTEFPCRASKCFEEQNIDRLLHSAPLPGGETDKLFAQLETLTQEIMQLRTEQKVSSQQGISQMEELSLLMASMVDATFINLLAVLDDEAREAPRLFSLEPVERNWSDWPKGIVSRKFRLTLWCEHSRLPLSLLNGPGDQRGVYELELPRTWFAASAPFLKTLFTTLSAVLPVALAGAKAIDLVLPSSMAEDLKQSLELATKGADSLKSWQDNQHKTAGTLAQRTDDTAAEVSVLTLSQPQIIDPSPKIASQGALRTVQDFLRKNDPSFGGLEKVRNQQRKVMWVHALFKGEY